MAPSQHHVSSEWTQNYLWRAVFVLMTTNILATRVAAAEGINWGIILTTIFISTSAEKANTTSDLYISEHVTSLLNEKNVTELVSGNETTRTLRPYDEILSDRLPASGEISPAAEASSSLKQTHKYTLNDALINSKIESKIYSGARLSATVSVEGTNLLHPLWNDSLSESRIRRSSLTQQCPEGSEACSCTEFRMNCDSLNISVLVIPKHFPIEVKSVSAAHNHLRAIPEMNRASHVVELSLAENEIEVANAKDLVNFPLLEKLDLSSNKLENFDLSEVKMMNLKQLNVSFNKLTKFSLQPINLTHLYLQGNMLSDVSFLSHLWKCEYVNLSHNRINNIPAHTFRNIPLLHSLDLQNNEIENTEFVSSITTRLVTLVLSNNKISNFSDTAFRDSKIVYLFLNNNTLRDVKFLIYVNAAVLNLNDNKLLNLNSKLFENKRNLKVLNLSGTNLTSMNFITSTLSLTGLGIEMNNITCLPEKFLKNHKSLGEWYLFGNPLEDLICPSTSLWTDRAVCNMSASDSKIQIHMKDKNINNIMKCVLEHRKFFEDCEQKCNSSSHMLFPSLFIIFYNLFNVI